jgi:hypothetical protein
MHNSIQYFTVMAGLVVTIVVVAKAKDAGFLPHMLSLAGYHPNCIPWF